VEHEGTPVAVVGEELFAIASSGEEILANEFGAVLGRGDAE
jgi:hypothetical protein